MALATGTNTSSLDGLYKKTGSLTCGGLQLAKQLDSRESIVGVIVTEVVDSVSYFLLPRLAGEIANKLTSFFVS